MDSAARDGGLFVGERRNAIRLPPYARLDARVQRTLVSSRGRLTVFTEVLNVLNRWNEGAADGSIQPLTSEAVGISRRSLSRRASIGIGIDLLPYNRRIPR